MDNPDRDLVATENAEMSGSIRLEDSSRSTGEDPSQAFTQPLDVAEIRRSQHIRTSQVMRASQVARILMVEECSEDEDSIQSCIEERTIGA